jgi:hypothetical protein
MTTYVSKVMLEGVHGTNLLYNPGWVINQRGISWDTGTDGSTFMTLDHWEVDTATLSTGVIQVDQSTIVPVSTWKSIRMYASTVIPSIAAGTYVRLQQKLEGYDVQALEYGTSDAKDVTVSFWVRSAVTGTFPVALYTGGSTVKTCVKSFTIDTADTFEFKTVTFPGNTSEGIDNDNTDGLRIIIAPACGSTYHASTPGTWEATDAWGISGQANIGLNASEYFYVSNIKMEIGSKETPIIVPPYGSELDRVRRYYQVLPPEDGVGGQVAWSGDVTNTELYYLSVPLIPRMRSAPTVSVTLQASSGFDTGTFAVSGTPGPSSFRAGATANASARAFFRFAWTADAKL